MIYFCSLDSGLLAGAPPD